MGWSLIRPFLGPLAGLLLVILGWLYVGHLRSSLESTQQALAVEQAAHQQARLEATATAEVLSARAQSKAQIVTITKEVIREVPLLVPAGTPALPPGWRLLHDAAAAGVPLPAGGTDAAPVAAQDAASTVIDNYGACRDTADQLERLQQWLKATRK